MISIELHIQSLSVRSIHFFHYQSISIELHIRSHILIHYMLLVGPDLSFLYFIIHCFLGFMPSCFTSYMILDDLLPACILVMLSPMILISVSIRQVVVFCCLLLFLG